MTTTKPALRIARTFDASPERVFAAWTEPAQIAKWWNPSMARDAVVHEADARPGGRLRLTMTVPEALPEAGTDTFPVEGRFVVVRPPTDLELTLSDGVVEPHTVRARFERVGAGTRMIFEVFGDFDEDIGMEEGWNACFDRLAGLVKQEGSGEMTQQTQTLRIERTYDCTPEALWAAWTDPKQYAKWFNPFPGKDAEIVTWELKEGGRVKFHMVMPDGTKLPNEGVFVKLDKPRELVTAEGDMRMRVTFEPVGDRTRLVMEQTGLPMEVPLDQARAGWGAIFDKLVAVLAGHEQEREGSQTLRFERTFECTPEEMWAAWTEPSQLAKWISPMPGVDAEVHKLDARVGGRISFTMIDAQGKRYPQEEGVFEVVDRPHTLVQYQSNKDRDDIFAGYPQRMKARFEPEGGKTRLVLEVTGLPPTFPLEAARGGFGACLDKLQSHLIKVHVRATSATLPEPGKGFTLERTFKAAPEKVWEMWTKPANILAWWGEGARDMGMEMSVREMDVRVGGKFAFVMANKEMTLVNSGTYTRVEPVTHLAWTWHFDIFLAPGEKPYDVPISVALEKTPSGGTKMTFKQGPLASPEFTEGSRQGVTANFEKLAKALGE